MASGLVALLDDVAAIARLAAASADDIAAASMKASSKAMGVVVDDAAVTPKYVSGLTPARELPIIWRIAKGSLVNKLVIILPIALLLSSFAPWALTPILMLGGTYLCFEGAEKIWHSIHSRMHQEEKSLVPKSHQGPKSEDALVKGAITTDLILSAEIMVISLNEIADESFWMRTGVLITVGLGITALVYGVVALIVKMDDIGLRLTLRDSSGSQRIGHALVGAMPRLLAVISLVGTLAMLWVGGHILLVSLDELGLHAPYGLVHDWEVAVHDAVGGVVGSGLGWVVNTLASAVVGVVVGAVAVAVMHLVPRKRAHGDS